MKRKNRFWEVNVPGATIGVVAKTAGAAARRAFRHLIRPPQRLDAPAKPGAVLDRQPASELDGNFEDTTIRLVA